MAPAPHPLYATNEGRFDRMLRVVMGGVILALGVTFETWWGAVGLVPLVTGLAGFSPLYAFFGIDTHLTHSARSHPR